MDRWSGPGRALEVHLNEWEAADTARRQMDAVHAHAFAGANAGAPKAQVSTDQIPHRQRVWFSFATTYAWNDALGANGDVRDGATNSAKEPDAADIDRWSVPTQQQASALAERFAADERAALDGPTYYVCEPVIDEVDYATGLAAPDPLFDTDVPSPSGFAVLERPIVISDLHPDTGEVDERFPLPLRAFAWTTRSIMRLDGTTGQGITVIWYADHDSWADLFVPAYAQATGEPFPAERFWPDRRHLMPLEANPWAFGVQWTEGPVGDHKTDDGVTSVPGNVSYQRRWLHTFFRLLWQDVIRTEPKRHTRPDARRILRARMPDDGYVRVLRMRRIVDPFGGNAAGDDQPDGSGSGSGLLWRHRVRGHWRNVHVKSAGPARLPDGSMDPQTHRRTWIPDYERGPESAPFIDGYDVTAVVR
jgi:hypothetical protein